MKRKKIKQDSFLKGAFIATFAIVICKILGIVYAVPFYAIVGEQGGALYGYAYSIYSIFLGISNAGIPLAMSKIISEYHTLGYERAKDRAFSLANKLLSTVGIISFIVLFLFADMFAYAIIGNTVGGNSVSDVSFVIRVISLAILVVPLMSTFRGYFQGHKYIYPTSISQVLEQIVRVSIIIFGSYAAAKIFNLELKYTVSVALLAATLGALVSFLYLYIKKKKNKEMFHFEENTKEKKISDKEIIKKLMLYAVPFIMIDIFNSLYNFIDTFMLVKLFVGTFDYTKIAAESILSVFTTWGSKINMIIIALAPGIMTSLIPNLTSSIAKKNYDDVKKKINQTLQILAYLSIPMVIGLSFLAGPIWKVFYGVSEYGPNVYKYYAFVAVATIFYTATITATQLLREYKTVFIALLSGLISKALLNIPLIYLFNKLALPEYYGAITASIIGYITCIAICLIKLHTKYKVEYKDTFKKIIETIATALVMLLILTLLKDFLPFNVYGRIKNIMVVGIYSTIGATIYLIITYKTKLIDKIFGHGLIDKIKNIFKKKRNS